MICWEIVYVPDALSMNLILIILSRPDYSANPSWNINLSPNCGNHFRCAGCYNRIKYAFIVANAIFCQLITYDCGSCCIKKVNKEGSWYLFVNVETGTVCSADTSALLLVTRSPSDMPMSMCIGTVVLGDESS